MYAKITAYKGKIICELLVDHDVQDIVYCNVNDPNRYGNTIHDTTRNLGISEEALDLMKTIKRGRDDVGDLDWYRTGVRRNEAGEREIIASLMWWGSHERIIDPDDAVTASTFSVLEKQCIIIPNDVSESSIKAIDVFHGG